MRSCLVVLSGGQDSTTCLFWAREQCADVRAITFDYAQRHRAELAAAAKVAQLAGVPHEVVPVGPILRGRSPLTDPSSRLETYESFEQMDKVIGDRVELTFVPMRNAFFLTLAANHAVAQGVFDLVTGVCQSDNANYPDCRDVFIKAQEWTINYALGLNERFRIHAPLLGLTKADIVRMGVELPGCTTALAWSHTAYSGEYPPVTQDHATVLRAHGYLSAGYPDPLIVRAWREGLMELPATPNYDRLRGERPNAKGAPGGAPAVA